MTKRIIPISELTTRSNYVSRPIRESYPLFATYKKIYNYGNINQCISRWKSFNDDEEVCFEQALSLMDYVLEKGNVSQKKSVVSNVKDIATSLQEPKKAKGVVSRVIKTTDNPVKKEAYQSIEESLIENAEILRVINNHSMISKRFGVDSFVREAVVGLNDPSDIIYELCSFINTYKLGLDSKYKIALEECLFSMTNIGISEKSIVESVTDYFIFNEMQKNDTNGKIFDIMQSICENSMFINDYQYVRDLKESRINKSHDNDSLLLTENDKAIMESLDKVKDMGTELIKKFKALPDKKLVDVQSIITKLFVLKRDEDVVHDTTNVLSLIFYLTIVTGALAIGVLPGLLALIASKTINMHLERKYYDKVLQKWYAQRDATARKIENCKDPEKKKKLEEYLKELDANIEKLESYSDSMRGEDEKKSDEKRPTNYSKKDDDLGDFDFGFGDEAATLATDIEVLSKGIDNITWDKNKIESVLYTEDALEKLDTEDLNYLVEFAVRFPGMLNKNKLLEAVEFKEKLISECDNSVLKYIHLTGCSSIKEKLNKEVNENKYIKSDITPTELFKEINDMYKYTSNINHYVNCINELSIANNLKLAADKLMNGISNLSDKEQVASRTLDGACRLMQRSIEKAMTMENREAVIRGDILPSMSKIIKLAAVTGIAAFIHPALAAIILIGKFAMSSKIRTKERQMVLDELEVELKMIDKHIQDADEKKDYKKEKELMLIKKKLQNQNARLRYNLHIEWGDDSVHTDISKQMEEKNKD